MWWWQGWWWVDSVLLIACPGHFILSMEMSRDQKIAAVTTKRRWEEDFSFVHAILLHMKGGPRYQK
jgi:hypothetical protein